MQQAIKENKQDWPDLSSIDPQLEEEDWKTFSTITSIEIPKDILKRIEKPETRAYGQLSVMAVHWHPEFVPFDSIRKRINHYFPNKEKELIIPTDHNRLRSYDDFTGVEVDCASREFNRKVQLLCHFENSKLENAHSFKSMLQHTARYRSSQLHNFIDALRNPEKLHMREEAAAETGANTEVVKFVSIYAEKIFLMLEQKEHEIPPIMLRNKMLPNFFDQLTERYSPLFIERTKHFIRAVKKIVKRDFSLEFFYETREIIEEVRGLGGGIIIPHPEEFWPVLLADYDVDGYEAWNPQSQMFTDFLINVVIRGNKARKFGNRSLLLTMGDDCHMGEKAKPVQKQNEEKAKRQIGYQPAWEDLSIRKSLDKAGVSRSSMIDEYKARLIG